MEWTREHDRVLAERCYGITVKAEAGDKRGEIIYVTPDNLNRYGEEREHIWGSGYRVPDYSVDIAACIWAAEAWREQAPERRTWLLRAQHIGNEPNMVGAVDEMVAEVEDVGAAWDNPKMIHVYGKWRRRDRFAAADPAKALASALYEALTQ